MSILQSMGVDVSRETGERLRTYLDLLQRWQRAINLVAASTLDDPWRRHALDSAQLLPLIPIGSERLVDLGSGSGLPGLILAAHRPDLRVLLVDSDARKAAFQREAARHMGLGNVSVVIGRIEKHRPSPSPVVTARALASLTTLLEWSAPWVTDDGIRLFHKGIRFEDELTEARRQWKIDVDIVPSMADVGSVILRINHAEKGSA